MSDLMSAFAREIAPYAPPLRLNAALYKGELEDGIWDCNVQATFSLSRSRIDRKGEIEIFEYEFGTENHGSPWPCTTRTALRLFLFRGSGPSPFYAGFLDRQ